MHRIRLGAAVAPALVLVLSIAACGPTGQPGVNGQVRFTEIVSYANTQDLSAPIATGATLLIGLEAKTGGGTRTGLTLAVQQNGHAAGTVSPMGFGQYAVVLPSPGKYDLVAMDGKTEVDHLPVTAATPKSLMLSDTFEVVTSAAQCGQGGVRNGDLSAFVLHSNQQLTVYAVPRDSGGEPMLGLLPLTASAPDAVALSSPYLGAGARGNGLRIAEAGTLGATMKVTITDPDIPASTSFELKTSSSAETLSCP